MGRHRLASWALALVVGAVSRPVWAGPVNAEKLRADSDAPGWSGSLDVRISVASGNVDRLDAGHGGGLQWKSMHRPGVGFGGRKPPVGAPPFMKDQWFLVTDAAYSQLGGNDITHRGLAHMRYTRMWVPRVGTELFVQVQYNKFTRLRTRLLGGGGLRLDMIHRKTFMAWLGSGYMVEYELNDTVDGDPHPSEIVNHRWTSYAVGQLRVWDQRLAIRSTTYAQPRFDAFTDVRVLQALQVEARAAPVFALGVDFNLIYDSRPPREVEPLDLLLGTYIRVGFP